MSALALVTFIICASAVALNYSSTGDSRFLFYAIPALALLLLIPISLAWMSRKSFNRSYEQVGAKAVPCKIGKITPSMLGSVIRVSGEVKKISFRWLNRPHLHIEDNTGRIRVIIFTEPSRKIKTGDRVEAVGIVMKYPIGNPGPIISAVSVKKIER